MRTVKILGGWWANQRFEIEDDCTELSLPELKTALAPYTLTLYREAEPGVFRPARA